MTVWPRPETGHLTIMPNCFQLIDKSTGKAENFARIDSLICEHYGVPEHETKFFMLWYDVIGFKLACGHSFARIREAMRNQVIEDIKNGDFSSIFEEWIIRITYFIEARYTSSAWVEIGRR